MSMGTQSKPISKSHEMFLTFILLPLPVKIFLPRKDISEVGCWVKQPCLKEPQGSCVLVRALEILLGELLHAKTTVHFWGN